MFIKIRNCLDHNYTALEEHMLIHNKNYLAKGAMTVKCAQNYTRLRKIKPIHASNIKITFAVFDKFRNLFSKHYIQLTTKLIAPTPVFPLNATISLSPNPCYYDIIINLFIKPMLESSDSRLQS